MLYLTKQCLSQYLNDLLLDRRVSCRRYCIASLGDRAFANPGGGGGREGSSGPNVNPGNAQVTRTTTRVFHEARTNALGTRKSGAAPRPPTLPFKAARTSSWPSKVSRRRTPRWRRLAVRPKTPRTTGRTRRTRRRRRRAASPFYVASVRHASARHTTSGCRRPWSGSIGVKRARRTSSRMTWSAVLRRNRRVPIRPACPIRTIRSIFRSIRPSRPSTCSIIRGERPSRSGSMCFSSIPAAGCASFTISLCEYIPFRRYVENELAHFFVNTLWILSLVFVTND